MSEFGHNPLCQQAMDIDRDVTACICDWVDAAQRDTEELIIKSLEAELEAHRAGKETKLNMESLPKIAADLDDVIWFIQGENK